MNRTPLLTAAAFLAFVVLTLGAGYQFHQLDAALKLAFLEVLTFVAALAWSARNTQEKKARQMKQQVVEEVLLQGPATYYPPRALVEEGRLFATRNFIVFRYVSGAQISLPRKDILGALQDAPSTAAAAGQGFSGYLLLRMQEADYRFRVAEISQWLKLFDDLRFGAMPYQANAANPTAKPQEPQPPKPEAPLKPWRPPT